MAGEGKGRGANGHASDDPEVVVDAAVDAVEREDFEAGQMAALAADFLTAGEGLGAITQPRLQEFLWYQLPAKTPHEDWAQLADGAARLLDKLGLDRYAEIARSETTRAVLAAWEDGGDAGLDRYRTETERSGVMPPDCALITWGDVMGTEEARAYDAVAVALEGAILVGELKPGKSGWRATAARVTRRTLEEPVRPVAPTDLRRHRRVDLVLGSRVQQWCTAVIVESHRERRARVAAHLLDGPVAMAPDLPPAGDIEVVVAPAVWLLEACRAGARATAAGYLEPALVREAAERFGWWSFEGQPRSEVDVFELALLREFATRNRWIWRRGTRIRTTRSGLAILEDHIALWQAIAGTIGRASEFSSMVTELVAIRLLDGPAQHIGLYGEPGGLASVVAEVMLEQGWAEDHRPLREWSVERAIHEPLRELRLFGLVGEDPAGRDVLGRRLTVGLNDTGKAAAWAHLYRRATEPRSRILE